MINPMDLTGKHILITGASSGIGQATAIQASKLGAKVTLVARREDALRETIQQMDNPELHAYYPFDMSNIEGIEGVVDKLVKEQGPLDGFLHSVGIGALRALKMNGPDFVMDTFKVNFFSFVELVRVLMWKKRMRNGASIVGISSCSTFNYLSAQSAYAASKGAMDGFLTSAATELASRKIRINNVLFSWVNTKMLSDFLSTEHDSSFLNRHLLGVISTEAAANSILFLLSDACPYITGKVIEVTSGT